MTLHERRQINPAKVAAARTGKGMTKDAASKAAGLSYVGYLRWERQTGKRSGPVKSFDAYRLAALARALDLSPDDLTDPLSP